MLFMFVLILFLMPSLNVLRVVFDLRLLRLRLTARLFFQAEDGILALVRSRGLGDVYKRQIDRRCAADAPSCVPSESSRRLCRSRSHSTSCLLYTSDAADDLLCVDVGGRRII